MHRKTEVKDIITDAIDEMSADDEREENTEDEGWEKEGRGRVKGLAVFLLISAYHIWKLREKTVTGLT